MSPLSATLILLASLLAMHLLLVPTLWKSFKSVKARLPAIGAIAFSLAMAALPLGMAYLGLVEGRIDCLGRFCRVEEYAQATAPIAYWFGMAMRLLVGGLLFSLSLQAARVLAANWSRLPNREPLAAVSTKELRKRHAQMLQEQEEQIQDMTSRMVSPDELMARLQPGIQRHVEVQLEIQRREWLWKKNRVLVLGLVFLLLFVVGLVVAAGVMHALRA
jgi:hypothetical protein